MGIAAVAVGFTVPVNYYSTRLLQFWINLMYMKDL